MGMYSFNRSLYTTKAASAITSELYRVQDAKELTLFVRGSPSTTTVQGSNAVGAFSAIPETSWSVLTTIVSSATNLLNIEPGFQWIRCLRSETTEVILNGRVDW